MRRLIWTCVSAKWIRALFVCCASYVFTAVAELHHTFVVVPADKASNNIVFVCKTHYIKCLKKEIVMSIATGKATYKLTTLSREEILQKHISVMMSFGISLSDEDLDLPKLNWISKLHKSSYKQRYVASLAKCSTKHLSQILTRVPTAVNERLQKYCNTHAQEAVSFKSGYCKSPNSSYKIYSCSHSAL